MTITRLVIMVFLLIMVFSPGFLSAQELREIPLEKKQSFEEVRQKQYSHSYPYENESPQRIMQRYRTQATGRSSGIWTRAKMEEPVCELRSIESPGHTFVAPPDNFYEQYEESGRAGSDCSNIVVTYNFPPDISQERRDQFIFAYEYAAAIWESQINSPITIKVEANFLPLGPGILGSAGPNFIWTDGVVWYGEALADQLFGADLSQVILGQDVPDIVSNFSTSFGWYLGVDGQAPPGTFDFVTVVVHELGHGLGFFDSAFAISDIGLGVYGLQGLPFIFDTFIEDGRGAPLSDIAPPSTVSAPLADYLTSNDLFINAPSVNGVLGSPAKIYAPFPFAPGSSIAHWDEATFPAGDPNSLMTPFIGFQEANHDPGAITVAMFNDHDWTLSQDCDGPSPVDLSERCDITGISFDPNFPGPVCDNPGVFSPNGGVFGPVGSHVVCFRVEGIDPLNQPLDPSGYSVKINGKTYPIIALGYDVFENEPYLFVCVGGVASDAKKNLQVKIKLAPGCTFTEPRLYDSPDCGVAKVAELPEFATTNKDQMDHFSAFPNPSKGFITVNTGNINTGQLIILNNVGQRVFQQKIVNDQQLNLDLSDQPAGLYFIQLVNENERQTQKILINR